MNFTTMTDTRPPAIVATDDARKGRNVWMERLRLAITAGPAALIAFARELDDLQQTKAQEQWQAYTLWRHRQTGEFLGVISPEGKCRRVQKAYHLPYWVASGPDNPFTSTISATNSALAKLARTEPEWTDAALCAFVNPKHAYIAGKLVEQARTQGARA